MYGCATSPRTHFYTLSRSDAEAEPSRASATQAPFYIEVAAVEIPASVARAQWVITDRSGVVHVKEQHRWLAPLDDQIRTAVSEALCSQLHTLDVAHMPHAFTRPVYRITLDVQRFETKLGETAGQARIDAIWNVQQIDPSQKEGRASLTCRVSMRESAALELHALSQSHQHALGRIATQIAATIRALEAMRINLMFIAEACPKVTQSAPVQH